MKNIIGIGVLTLANGMAAGTGVGPATIAMALVTLASAFSFALIGRVCDASGLGSSCAYATGGPIGGSIPLESGSHLTPPLPTPLHEAVEVRSPDLGHEGWRRAYRRKLRVCAWPWGRASTF